jgi:hypothetical protein
MIYITIECRMYNCLDGIKAWAPELTMASPRKANHGG